MKLLTKLVCVALAVITPLFSFGCSATNSTTQTYNSTKYFNSPVHVEVYSKPLTDDVINEIDGVLALLDGELSTTKPTSNVARFNGAKVNERIEFLPTAMEVINKATEYYTATDGKFNFTVYPLVELWQFSNYDKIDKSTFSPPDESDIERVKSLCNPEYVKRDGNALYKTVEGVKVDFGGLAKGYATERIAEILKANDYTDGYVSIGSSSFYILGLNSDENVLSIRHPRKNGKAIIQFTKAQTLNTTISTSGDYERYFEYNGERFSHIIDGLRGEPTKTGVISASVLGGDACFTDALTTSLCLTERNEIENVIKLYPDLRIFVVYEKDGVKELITNQADGELTLLDKEYIVVKV